MSHVIIERRPDDWMFGINSRIIYEERLASGMWREYDPPGEWQGDIDTDTSGCVSFAGNNSLEIQQNRYLYHGELGRYFLKNCIHLGYIKGRAGQPVTYEAVIANPRDYSFEYSDRALAKLSFTTKDGNSLPRVGDTIRHVGLVAEARWPNPKSYTWDSYYATVPADIVKECGVFSRLFKVEYEYLDATVSNLLYHLKHAPLWVVIPGHAVVEIRQTQDLFEYFDSYEPFIKGRVGVPQVAFKLLVTPLQDMKRVIALEGTADQYLVEGVEKHKIPDLATQKFLQDTIKIITGFVETVQGPEFNSIVTGKPMPSVAADDANRAIYTLYKEKLPLLQDAYESNQG